MSCRPQIPQAGKACAAKLVVSLLLVRSESHPIDRSDSDQEAGAICLLSSANNILTWYMGSGYLSHRQVANAKTRLCMWVVLS